MRYRLSKPDAGTIAQEIPKHDTRKVRKFWPFIIGLESRLMLDGSSRKVTTASETVKFSVSRISGEIEIEGTRGADMVEIGRNARGFVTLTANGKRFTADPRDGKSFDRRLIGFRADRLRGVSLVSGDAADTLALSTALGDGRMPARVLAPNVVIAEALETRGTLAIEASSIVVSAPVSADRIELTASRLVNLEAVGSLVASGGVVLKSDRLIQAGHVSGFSVEILANVAMRSGSLTASGGTVNITFTQNYVATQGATIDVSSEDRLAGSIKIDGGETGHLFNSGMLLARGGETGGEIRVSGRDVVWIGGGADATGGKSGGTIHVGGGWQGSDASMTNAATIEVSAHTGMTADGADSGGKVVLWSNESTLNYASISATGLTGGAVEISSKVALEHGGSVEVGKDGKFLLDPKNIMISENAISGVAQFAFANPTPNAGDAFGAQVFPLSTGKIVVVDPYDDAVATDAGAVYVFDGQTGGLISALTGSTAGDWVGAFGVTAVGSGNFVILSYLWDNAGVSNAGAVTWGSGTSGVSGLVSASNSLVGTNAGDNAGAAGITVLPSGNYLVRSPNWDNGAATNAGALTWGNGATGIAGAVSAANSLIGSTTSDLLGNAVPTILPNGNYLISTSTWDNGAATNAGAVTWGSGTAGVSGAIGSANSLVGIRSGDGVGTLPIDVLANSNYIVRSPSVDFLLSTDSGAVTWGSGTTGVRGTVSSSNSLIGTNTGDGVGSETIVELPGGNYAIRSPWWDNGANVNAGAVTWASGTTGVTGTISTTNSLVGSSTGDNVGIDPIVVLPSGNFLVDSPFWGNQFGAVTFVSGSTGLTGLVSAANSLVGSTANDDVGSEIMVLANGNYLVLSPNWNNGSADDAGAVTWGSGTSGVLGFVSSSNSLVGSRTNDGVGADFNANPAVTELTNGNYVVNTPGFDDGPSLPNTGAVTWGSGTLGVKGTITSTNSLIGFFVDDFAGSGGIVTLPNGNYLVRSPSANRSLSFTNAGAVTWGSGTSGVKGLITSSNSLIGSSTDDSLASNGITVLSSGNYLVKSPLWDNGGSLDAGAVTWGSGLTGISGLVSAGNSLVGSATNDLVGADFNENPAVTELTNGNYVVNTPGFDVGVIANAGAVTWGSGTTGVKGAITSTNSLIGYFADDYTGSGGIIALPNGNYLVRSPSASYTSLALDSGAVSWGSGTSGVIGFVSPTNSLMGSHLNDSVGSFAIHLLNNGNYVVSSPGWDNGTIQNAGAVTWGNGSAGVTGIVSASNSLVGTQLGDQVGSGFAALANGNYVVLSDQWDHGAISNAGAVTWASGTTATTGQVSAANSLVGARDQERVGIYGIVALSNGNYVVRIPTWDNGAVADAGAVTWGSGTVGVSGTVSAANSLVGSKSGDRVGSDGIFTLPGGHFFVLSPNWDRGLVTDAGAITWVNGSLGKSGTVSAANSIVGAIPGAALGTIGDLNQLSSGKYMVASDYSIGGIDIDSTAMTWIDPVTGTLLDARSSGVVGPANSLLAPLGSTTTADSINGTIIVGKFGFDDLQVLLPMQLGQLAIQYGQGVTFGKHPGSTANMTPDFLESALSAGTTTTLQANNDVTLSVPVIVIGSLGDGGDLTMTAGRSVTFASGITTANGDLNVTANANLAAGLVAGHRDSGAGAIVLAPGNTIDTGTGNVNFLTAAGESVPGALSGGVSLGGTLKGGSISIVAYEPAGGQPDILLNGNVNAIGSGGIMMTAFGAIVMGAGAVLSSSASLAPITMTSAAIGLRGTISTNDGNLTFNAAVTQTGSFVANQGLGAITFDKLWDLGTQQALLTGQGLVVLNKGMSMNGGSVSAGGTLSLVDNASLLGRGSISANVTFGANVVIAPGVNGSSSGGGVLNFGAHPLTLSSTSKFEANGTSVAAFDRLVASGVALNGATLDLSYGVNVLGAGQSVTLIYNTSTAPVSGTFAGLAEGSLFAIGNQLHRITYSGGDGNDVVVMLVSDITSSFSSSLSGLVFIRSSSSFRQIVTLGNTSSLTRRPRTLKFSGLHPLITINGGTKIGDDWYLTFGELTVPIGGSIGLPVFFKYNGFNGTLGYTLQVIGS